MNGGRLRSSGGAPLTGLSVDSLDRRLGLRRRGREDGAGNIPGDDDPVLSDAERDLTQTLAAARARIDAERHAVREELEARLRGQAPAAFDFTAPSAEARLLLRQVAGRIAHDWTSAASRAARARADLEGFRREHDLRRGAVYPDSGLLQAGLLLTAAMFEALFSAALFAEESERGLLGGAIVAVGLSGANVTLGFLSGFLGLRHLQHRRLSVRCAGAAGFAAFAMLALMLNLFAADWRDRMAALGAPQDDLTADAGFHLWAVLQLDSPQAVILLMLGAGVWVFAALKGYSGFDDPYPDYGRMDRAARAAGEQLSAFRAAARAELEAPVDAARAAISARLERLRADLDAMQKSFDAAAVKIEALNAQARALDVLAAEAAALYRRANAAARTSPPPAYFDGPPLSLGALPDALAAPAAILEDARAKLQRGQTDAHAALADLLNELNRMSGELDGHAAS